MLRGEWLARRLASAIVLALISMTLSCQQGEPIEYDTVSLPEAKDLTAFRAEVEVIHIVETISSGVDVMIGLKKPTGERIGISGFPADPVLVELAKSLRERN